MTKAVEPVRHYIAPDCTYSLVLAPCMHADTSEIGRVRPQSDVENVFYSPTKVKPFDSAHVDSAVGQSASSEGHRNGFCRAAERLALRWLKPNTISPPRFYSSPTHAAANDWSIGVDATNRWLPSRPSPAAVRSPFAQAGLTIPEVLSPHGLLFPHCDTPASVSNYMIAHLNLRCR